MRYCLQLLYLFYGISLLSCSTIGYKSVAETPLFLREVSPYELKRILNYPLCIQNLPSTQCTREDDATLGDMFTSIYEEHTGNNITTDELLDLIESAETNLFSDITIQKLNVQTVQSLKDKGRLGTTFYQFIVPDTEDNNLVSLIIGIQHNTVYIVK